MHFIYMLNRHLQCIQNKADFRMAYSYYLFHIWQKMCNMLVYDSTLSLLTPQTHRGSLLLFSLSLRALHLPLQSGDGAAQLLPLLRRLPPVLLQDVQQSLKHTRYIRRPAHTPVRVSRVPHMTLTSFPELSSLFLTASSGVSSGPGGRHHTPQCCVMSQ